MDTIPPPPPSRPNVPDNVMLRFPQYGFVPVNIIWIRPNYWIRLIIIVATTLLLLALIPLVIAMTDFSEGKSHTGETLSASFFMLFIMFGLFPFLITAIACRHPFRKAFPRNKRRRKKMALYMDYIQYSKNWRGRYLFIVKDNQFGLYDLRKLRIQIPTVYDQLWWQTEGAVLMGIKDGRNVLLDIYGHELH